MNRREVLAGMVAASAIAAMPSQVATEKRSIIVPDIVRCGEVERIVCGDAYTLRYTHMMRWDVDTGQMALARSDSATYREWLATDPYYAALPIPPHIQFGGCVTPIKGGDPTFHARWQARTRNALRAKLS